MQLIITHKTEPELVLPINYHHILQSIIFKAIEKHQSMRKIFTTMGMKMVKGYISFSSSVY